MIDSSGLIVVSASRWLVYKAAKRRNQKLSLDDKKNLFAKVTVRSTNGIAHSSILANFSTQSNHNLLLSPSNTKNLPVAL
jgi:hypothetical protein